MHTNRAGRSTKIKHRTQQDTAHTQRGRFGRTVQTGKKVWHPG